MKQPIISAVTLKSNLLIFLLSAGFAFAQQDSLYQNIEVVKITKLLPQQKGKIQTENADLLSHDAGKFLNSIPEINGIRKAGNYATDPVLRGFKYEQLNLIVDGAMSSVNACPSRMDPASSQISMNMVKEADVYKGPYFFRYGSALGGTINFKTFDPQFSDSTNVNGRISVGYESNGNVFRNEGLVTLSTKKLVWDLFGSYQKGNDYKDGNGNKVPSGFERYNFGTKANYKWNENNVTTLQVNTNQGRDIDFAALNMDLIYDKTWMFQLQHSAEFKNKLLHHINFNSYYSTVKHSMGTPNGMMVSDVATDTYGARTELMFMKNKNTFYTGLDYKHENAWNTGMKMPPTMPMRDGSSWQDSYINQVGWFNEYNYLFRKGKLSASLRLDYNSADAKEPSQLFQTLYGEMDSEDLNLSLSLGYSHFFSNTSQLSLWLGRAQRSGSLTERFINRFPVGIDAYEILGNPQIKPETNNQADLIYTLKKENFYFQVDGFYSYMQDYISGVINPDVMPYSMTSPGVRQVENIDKAFKTGIEANFNWQFLPKYRTEMAMAYTYAEDLASNQPLPEIAPLDFRWKAEANFQPVLIAVNYRYVAKQDRINPDFGELKTSSFNLFDIDFKYNVFPKAYFIGSVTNLFDKAYAEHLSRTLSTDKSQRILAPGRSYNLSFVYSF